MGNHDVSDVEMEEVEPEAFEGRLFDLLQNQAIIANDHVGSEDEAEMSDDEEDAMIMDNEILGSRRMNMSGELQHVSDEDSSVSDEESRHPDAEFASVSRA